MGFFVSRLDLAEELCRSFAQVVTSGDASRSGVGGGSGWLGGDVSGQISLGGQLSDSGTDEAQVALLERGNHNDHLLEDEIYSGTGSSVVLRRGKSGVADSGQEHTGHGESSGRSNGDSVDRRRWPGPVAGVYGMPTGVNWQGWSFWGGMWSWAIHNPGWMVLLWCALLGMVFGITCLCAQYCNMTVGQKTHFKKDGYVLISYYFF